MASIPAAPRLASDRCSSWWLTSEVPCISMCFAWNIQDQGAYRRRAQDAPDIRATCAATFDMPILKNSLLGHCSWREVHAALSPVCAWCAPVPEAVQHR